jgi:hypothetical protein
MLAKYSKQRDFIQVHTKIWGHGWHHMLRGYSNWPYVQENMFPSQGSDSYKVFVFKMSEVGPGSRVDLVKWMQPSGDLEDVWMMFDHVKCVKKWTTMACRIYESTYCRVMTPPTAAL